MRELSWLSCALADIASMMWKRPVIFQKLNQVLEGRVIYTLRTKHRKSPKSKTAKLVSGRE